LKARPSAEKSPVRDNEVPIRIGGLLLLPAEPLPLLLLLLQAARTIAAVAAAAARDKNRVR
jgi:hypothetical protein